MNDVWFLSFADSRLKGPLRRIRRQAARFGFAKDRTLVWTEHDISREFRERMSAHLVPGSRGYGYWCWKPQILLQAMELMKDGDILLYADAGCHLNPSGRRRFDEYVELVRKHGLLVFQSRSPLGGDTPDPRYHFLPERSWTKGALLDHFGVRDNPDVMDSGQIGAGIILLRKDAANLELLKRYREVFTDHFELCDDSPSSTPNDPTFVENRHDQSVFSILVKLRGDYHSLSSDEYSPCMDFAPPEFKNDPTWGHSSFATMRDMPILAKHDKGGWRSLIPRPLKRVLLRLLGHQ